MMTIAIADDGPGLAPENRERVFTIGERMDEATPGTGLGLAIARDLARLYGGDVRLHPNDGGGLVASVTLPLAH